MRMKEWHEISIELGKAVRRTVDQTAVEIFFAGPRNGVEYDVNTPPLRFDRIEYRLKLPRDIDVTGQEDLCAEFGCEGRNIGLRFVVQVGHGEVRSGSSDMFGRPPSEAVGIGNAKHERFAPLEVDGFHGAFPRSSAARRR